MDKLFSAATMADSKRSAESCDASNAITNFKVCCITNNPEQFKVEMDSIFGESKITMNKRPKNESDTMIHLDYVVNGMYTPKELENMVPFYVKRLFNFSVVFNVKLI